MKKMQVLVIDDSKQLAEAYQDILSNMGFQCEIAHTAKEAFATLITSVPDLILLDLRLGHEIGGDDILHQIRANPRFDGTRVIVITAYPEVARLISELADLVLLKPVDIDQLVTFSDRVGSFEIRSKPFPFRDPITLLFNKDFFQTQLEYAFARIKRHKEFLFAVIDLRLQVQGLQENEIHPDVWTCLVKEVAERLRRQMRTTDTIARFSAWKFVILAEGIKRPEDLDVIIKRVQETLEQPFQVGDERYSFAIRFGAAVYSEDFKKPEDMLAAATGGNRSFSLSEGDDPGAVLS